MEHVVIQVVYTERTVRICMPTTGSTFSGYFYKQYTKRTEEFDSSTPSQCDAHQPIAAGGGRLADGWRTLKSHYPVKSVICSPYFLTACSKKQPT